MIGKAVSHYKILEKLGEGGMGVVYKARDIKLDRTVALKFLALRLLESKGARKRFEHEAKTLALLQHQNICPIYERDEHDGQLFFVMAYCEGETIKQKIARGSLKLADILDFSIQAAQGLSEAHKKDIIHRDIKPANMMVVNNAVKILDFGIARVADVSMHTKTGAVFGTEAYMSPEQAQGYPLDHRTDIWSLGVSLYEMLTGQLPFAGDGDDEETTRYKIINKEPCPVREISESIPKLAGEIVATAMAKDREKRYQHMDEILADLELAFENSTGEKRKRGMSGISYTFVRRKLIPILTAGAMGLVFILAFWADRFWGDNQSTEPIQIAVADFINQTEEEEFNSLSGLLITAFEQSPRLSVLTRSRMYDILRQTTEEDIGRIDETLAARICRRAGINALASATIRKFDNLYAIDLRVIDPILDKHLFAAAEKGEGKASIPTMIDKLSRKTQTGLRIENQDDKKTRNVAEVTTFDFDAYDHFYRGLAFWDKMQDEKALQELTRAVALDSTFGLAYALLAIIPLGTASEDLAREPLSKAIKYIHRIPERERYLVLAIKAYFGEGPEAAIEALWKMEKIYPDDKRLYMGLGYFYYRLDDTTHARDNFERVLELDPDSEMARAFLSDILSAMK